MRKSISILAAITAIVSIFNACNNNSKGPSAEKNNQDSISSLVERGSYLANNVAVCMHCHSKFDVTKFSFPIIPGTEGGGGLTLGKGEGVPGEVTPPNITPYKLKDWTDDEIARSITQGINKKGDTLFPIMPYHNYSRLTKDDIYSIIAYLRTLKPIDSTTPPRKLEIPPAMYGPLPANNIADNKKPDPSDKVKYGEYMTTMASCGDCHTPLTPQGPDFSKAFSGGFVFDMGFMKVAVANITPDSATGIGSWREESFVQKFKSNTALAE